jgi:hypothetical protein
VWCRYHGEPSALSRGLWTGVVSPPRYLEGVYLVWCPLRAIPRGVVGRAVDGCGVPSALSSRAVDGCGFPSALSRGLQLEWLLCFRHYESTLLDIAEGCVYLLSAFS